MNTDFDEELKRLFEQKAHLIKILPEKRKKFESDESSDEYHKIIEEIEENAKKIEELIIFKSLISY